MMSAVSRQVIDVIVAGWFNDSQEVEKWTVVTPLPVFIILKIFSEFL